MAFKISAQLKKALQDELSISKVEVEDYVWNQKPQVCFLCSESLNRAADDIELDHDTPVDKGGLDTFANLNPTHAECNRYKKNHTSFDVRPHLKFKRFYDRELGQVKFSEAKAFFGLKKSEAYFSLSDDKLTATIETAHGKSVVPVYSEYVSGKEQLFCFANISISSVENDDDIQPREIKLNHLFAISADLKKNPLHEQPAIRVVGEGEKKHFFMFDGQHKTVAQLLNGKSECVFKFYINISKEEAVHLVNSIQARIKKLPLTPFELASKMSDEVRRKLEDYEQSVGSTEVSEEGFIIWLDAADRNRAKSGIEAAVLDSVISDDELAFSKIIERRGKAKFVEHSIQEAAFQSNVLKTLLHTKPLPRSYKGEAMKEARDREARNVIRILNLCYQKGFVPSPDKDQGLENARIKRLTYQASLRQLCDIMLQITSSHLMVGRSEVLIEKTVDLPLQEKLASAAERFFSHPVWIADLSLGSKAKLVDDALKKNQNIEEAFKAVVLTAAYCADYDKLPANWAGL